MRSPFTRWLLILIVLLAATAALGGFLWAQGSGTAGRAVGGLGLAATIAWLLGALIRWREVVWVARINRLALLTGAAALGTALCWALDWPSGVFFISSAWAMTALFIAGLWLLRAALSPGFGTLGVARTLLDEAIRMKTPMIFIVILLLMVPVLPLIVSGQDVLRYRVQTFLQWSMIIVSVLLSLMTLFLAVGSVTGEIRNRQIFLTLTKPVGRVQYLLGKWLGIAALNALLVAVAGAGIYAMTLWLAAQPGQTPYDKLMVQEQVLTARVAVDPTPATEGGMPTLMLGRLEKLRAEDPATWGQPGTSAQLLPNNLKSKIAMEVQKQWFTIPPDGRTVYRFSGIKPTDQAQTVQFSFKPKPAGPSPDGFVLIGFRINGRPYPNPYPGPFQGTGIFRLAEGEFHVIDITPDFISPLGVMDVELFNLPRPDGTPQKSLTFNIKDGIEVLYRDGSFAPNLVRSLMILWVRLTALGMLGLLASTFLGFPVACLMCILVYLAAAGHGYLTDSFAFYSAFPKDTLPLWDRIIGVPITFWDKLQSAGAWDASKVLIRMVGTGFTALVPSFSDYDPAPLLADGRRISWSTVGTAALWIGLVWSGIMGLMAAYLFHKREIAQVQI